MPLPITQAAPAVAEPVATTATPASTAACAAVLNVVQQEEAAVTVARLRVLLPGLPPRTLTRALAQLQEGGQLRRVRRGTYCLVSGASSDETGLSPLGDGPGQLIVDVLERCEADAHLTGYDILASYGHQFVFQYPHLLCCSSVHAAGVTGALADAGFVVVAAGASAPVVPAGVNVAVVRKQPPAVARHLLQQEHVAGAAKAWVDLLREVRRSELPFDYNELGRILRAMEDGGVQLTDVRAYARRLGYLAWLDATVSGSVAGDSDSEQQLRAQAQLADGYHS